MPDGSPCWCVSNAAPHEGWVHSTRCEQFRAFWAPDPLRAPDTDDDPSLPSGAAAAFAFVAALALVAFLLGVVIGRWTA
jgi:hypothetical protein